MTHHKVLWMNGTFLAPQLFQQSDRYFEAQSGSENPLAWGITALEINTALISRGQFGLVYCRAIMPDGLKIDLGRDTKGHIGEDLEPPIQPLSYPPGSNRTLVSLAIPSRSAAGRFVAESQDTVDEYKQESVRSILIGKKALRFHFGGQSAEGLTTLPLAEVERTSNDSTLLREDYLPPCFHIGASQYFPALIDRLSLAMEQRVQELSRLPQRSAADQSRLLVMCQSLPLLQQLREPEVRRATAPLTLFTELLRLTGGLQGAAREFSELPRYTHRNLWTCFDGLERRILQLVRVKDVEGDVERLPFTLLKGFEDFVTWEGRIPESIRLRKETKLYLELTGSFNYQRLSSKLPNHARICGPNAMKANWPGLAFSVVPPPKELGAAPAGALYLQLLCDRYPETPSPEDDRAYQMWNEVRTTRSLQVYIPSVQLDSARPQVELIHVRKEQP